MTYCYDGSLDGYRGRNQNESTHETQQNKTALNTPKDRDASIVAGSLDVRPSPDTWYLSQH